MWEVILPPLPPCSLRVKSGAAYIVGLQESLLSWMKSGLLLKNIPWFPTTCGSKAESLCLFFIGVQSGLIVKYSVEYLIYFAE